MSNITPQQLVGKRGINYNNEMGTIIAAEYVMDYKKIPQYDDSGWVTRESLKEELGLEEIDILVAFQDDEDSLVDVYTFEKGGVDLAEPLD